MPRLNTTKLRQNLHCTSVKPDPLAKTLRLGSRPIAQEGFFIESKLTIYIYITRILSTLTPLPDVGGKFGADNFKQTGLLRIVLGIVWQFTAYN
jgi:hypothetical protein